MTEANVQNVRTIVLEANAGDARQKAREKEKEPSAHPARRDLKPILPFSSMFIFTPTNPYALTGHRGTGTQFQTWTRTQTLTLPL